MKTAIITGANVGIGFATVKFLAQRPDWRVVLACRNASKANTAIETIQRALPQANLSFASLDLFSLSSVRRFPDELRTRGHLPIDGLVLNAGGINMRAKRGKR